MWSQRTRSVAPERICTRSSGSYQNSTRCALNNILRWRHTFDCPEPGCGQRRRPLSTTRSTASSHFNVSFLFFLPGTLLCTINNTEKFVPSCVPDCCSTTASRAIATQPA
uniref:(northern house mosquito) hypothetical protein n=1 Tax=Culex pipiens TaxID=7175 RepID=A0A8D8D8S3_CULPI